MVQPAPAGQGRSRPGCSRGRGPADSSLHPSFAQVAARRACRQRLHPASDRAAGGACPSRRALGTYRRGRRAHYFGLQRFGHGGNLVDARSCAEQDLLPANRNLRSRFLSAGRGYLFNRLLAERVAEGSWNRAAVGDLLAFTDSRSFFLAGEEECRDARLAALDLHPTGPLWGEAIRRAAPASRTRAGPGRARAGACRWLAKAGMAHERRILRLPIQGLAWHYPEPDVLQLEFVLPAGCFATVVVREILDLVPTGQTENPCAY